MIWLIIAALVAGYCFIIRGLVQLSRTPGNFPCYIEGILVHEVGAKVFSLDKDIMTEFTVVGYWINTAYNPVIIRYELMGSDKRAYIKEYFEVFSQVNNDKQ